MTGRWHSSFGDFGHKRSDFARAASHAPEMRSMCFAGPHLGCSFLWPVISVSCRFLPDSSGARIGLASQAPGWGRQRSRWRQDNVLFCISLLSGGSPEVVPQNYSSLPLTPGITILLLFLQLFAPLRRGAKPPTFSGLLLSSWQAR